MQEYELERLLSGELEIPDAETGDIHTAGLFSCLQLLIHFGEELEGNPNPDDEAYDGLRYILGAISSDKLVHDLQLITVEVVGVEYYEKFQQKIQGMELTLESARDLEKDPELQEHLELMAWLAMVGLFVEALYTYFNIQDQEL